MVPNFTPSLSWVLFSSVEVQRQFLESVPFLKWDYLRVGKRTPKPEFSFSGYVTYQTHPEYMEPHWSLKPLNLADLKLLISILLKDLDRNEVGYV